MEINQNENADIFLENVDACESVRRFSVMAINDNRFVIFDRHAGISITVTGLSNRFEGDEFNEYDELATADGLYSYIQSLENILEENRYRLEG